VHYKLLKIILVNLEEEEVVVVVVAAEAVLEAMAAAVVVRLATVLPLTEVALWATEAMVTVEA
jgi:hypothetical protein